MANKVLETEAFSHLFGTIESREKEWIKKIIKQLESNIELGKPLQFKWFREKKFENKRLYYLIYENSNTVLLVAFGKKKQQQAIIDNVLKNRERYKRLMEG